MSQALPSNDIRFTAGRRRWLNTMRISRGVKINFWLVVATIISISTIGTCLHDLHIHETEALTIANSSIIALLTLSLIILF